MTAATATTVQYLNLAYFGRPADPASLIAFPASGMTDEQIVAAFVKTDEYSVGTITPNSTANTGGGRTYNETSLINTLYQRLFGRLAEASEIAGWSAAIKSGAVNYDYLGITMLNAGLNLPAGTPMRDVLLAKVASADAFSASLSSDAASNQAYTTSAAAASGASFLSGITTSTAATATEVSAAVASMVVTSATPGSTFTLTTAVDTFTGGVNSDTFNATSATFTVLDKLDGGAGIDTLNVTDTSGALSSVPAAASVSGVENLVINTSKGIGSVATTAVAQKNTYTMGAPTAATRTSTTIVVGATAHGGDSTQTVTYGGNTSTYFHDDSAVATSAANMVAAFNTAAGSTVAFIGATPDLNGTPAATATSIVVDGTGYNLAKVGQTVAFTGATTRTITAVAIDAVNSTATLTLDGATGHLGTNNETITIGGGLGGVTVLGPTNGTATTTSVSKPVGHTVTLTNPGVVGTVGNSVSFTYGTQTGTYLIGATASDTGDNFVAALNAVAGSTIAVNTSGSVAVSAPTAGTALETITFTGSAGDTPTVAFTTANVAGATASQYDISGFAGLTTVTTASEEALNLKLAATTDGNFTTAGGAVSIAGGKDLTVTHSKTGANAIAIAAGSDVTVTANKATSGTVDINGATGTVNVAYNGEFANTANATNGATTVAKGGSTITVAQTSGASGATLASTNYTVTQGAVSVTGGSSTTSVTVKQDAAVSKVDGTGATGAVGVVQGGVTVTDGNVSTATDTITSATLHNFGATTITSDVFNGLNVVADPKNASGAVTINKSAATTAGMLTVAGQGKMGAIDGTLADLYTSVYFNATGDLTVADINFAKATSISAAGTGVTTITAHTDDAKVTSYTSLGGGLAVGAEIGTAVTFTGGAGKDSVLIGATTKAISLGGGDDSATMSAALGAGGTLAGGLGTDTLTLNVVASTFADPSAQPRISGFENLSLGALADGVYNASGFTALSQGDTADNVSYTNVAAGTGLTVTASSGEKIDVVLADATGTSDVFNLAFSSAGAIDFNHADKDITIAGIETLNITSTDTNTTAHVNTVDFETVNVKSVTLTGNTGFTFDHQGTNGGTLITSFDASGITGKAADAANLAVTFTSANATVGQDVVIKTGSGNDVITGAAANDAVTLGDGADKFVYAGGGGDVVTGGAGVTTLDVNHVGSKTRFLTLADAKTGDKIDVAGASTGTLADVSAANWKAAKITLGNSATFDEYLTASFTGNGSVAALAKWFQFGGDTYIAIQNDNTGGFNAGTDSFIKLTGALDISGSSFANEILTLSIA